MDITQIDSISSKKMYKNINTWNKSDFIWILSLYGTAIGAGVLFLPINAGMGGIIPVILMTFLAFPMTFFSHRGLTRFVLSGSTNNCNIINVVEEHFGKFSGNFITLLYFFAIYPILLMYGVSITNNVENFISELLGYNVPPRWFLSFVLISCIMSIVIFGEKYIVKIMSMIVFPFIIVLLLFSMYMIPYWNLSVFKMLFNSTTKNFENKKDVLITIYLTIPVMIFSFNHSPIISSFAVDNKKKYGIYADKKSSRILAASHILMIATVMFFVFSCVFTLSPDDLMRAKIENISVLDYLSTYFNKPFIKYSASVIAFVSIIKSFLGHYLGAREGLNGLVKRIYQFRGKSINLNKINKITFIFMMLTTWLVSTFNPSILNIIESLGGPVIAILLFIIPMYSINKISSMNKYSGKFSNIFVVVIGIICFSSTIYKLFI